MARQPDIEIEKDNDFDEENDETKSFKTHGTVSSKNIETKTNATNALHVDTSVQQVSQHNLSHKSV